MSWRSPFQASSGIPAKRRRPPFWLTPDSVCTSVHTIKSAEPTARKDASWRSGISSPITPIVLLDKPDVADDTSEAVDGDKKMVPFEEASHQLSGMILRVLGVG